MLQNLLELVSMSGASREEGKDYWFVHHHDPVTRALPMRSAFGFHRW